MNLYLPGQGHVHHDAIEVAVIVGLIIEAANVRVDFNVEVLNIVNIGLRSKVRLLGSFDDENKDIGRIELVERLIIFSPVSSFIFCFVKKIKRSKRVL